jgi:plasmid segregation protein ParM
VTIAVGLDIGYSYTKVKSGQGGEQKFPSVVGTADIPAWELARSEAPCVVDGKLVGQEAIDQSIFEVRRLDPAWTTSPEWMTLFYAGLTEVTRATQARLLITLGLPIDHYALQKAALVKRVEGKHYISRWGRTAQVLTVVQANVVPQPVGALLDAVLDDQGRLTDEDLATSKVGVIDVGSGYTGFFVATTLREVVRLTDGLPVGMWKAVRLARRIFAKRFPDLTALRDHDIAAALVRREVSYFGKPEDITDLADSLAADLAATVVGHARTAWGTGAGLGAILVTGGGGAFIYPHVQAAFRHARLVPQPLFGNVRGFYKLARRKCKGAE